MSIRYAHNCNAELGLYVNIARSCVSRGLLTQVRGTVVHTQTRQVLCPTHGYGQQFSTNHHRRARGIAPLRVSWKSSDDGAMIAEDRPCQKWA